MQQEVVIASACRTAIGKFQGTLKDTPVKELGALVGRAAVTRRELPMMTSMKSFAVMLFRPV